MASLPEHRSGPVSAGADPGVDVGGAPVTSAGPAHEDPPGPEDAGSGVPAGAPVTARAFEVTVPLGRRVMVFGDLLLGAEATPASHAQAADIAVALERWDGPGLAVVCGNLFVAPESGTPLTAEVVEASLRAHRRLAEAVTSFTARPDSRLLVLPGWRDPELGDDDGVAAVLTDLGIEVVPDVDLVLVTAAGERRVLVRPARPAPEAGPALEPGPADRPYLTGIDRLEDPSASARFVTSRLLYRRLRRFIWVPPVLAVVIAVLIRLTVVFNGVNRLVRRAHGPRHALYRAYAASWPHRALFTLAVIVVFELALAAVVTVVSRRVWRAHVGMDDSGGLPTGRSAPSSGLTIGGRPAIDEARDEVARGATGLIAGGGLEAELIALTPGFFASPGGTTELVREHPGRAGLPPVFLHHRQTAWIELETGAELHVRLLLADADLPSSTMLERLLTGYPVVKGYKAAADLHPAMVASWPRGASWPPAPEVAADRTRTRRARRLAGAAIFVAGLVDLLLAVSPPLRSRLHLVEQVIPLGVAQAAGALVAMSGIALMMLARGVLRGQRRAWLVSVGLLAGTLVLHLVHGAELGAVVLTAAVLGLLIVERAQFGTASDQGSLRSAFSILFLGALIAVVAATVAAELATRVRHHPIPAWPVVMFGAFERLAGITTVSLPDTIDDWLFPSMLAVGLMLLVIAIYLFTRPVVDRQLSSSHAVHRAAELRARDIVRRHGTGTLDYFALRDDKKWFIHRDSLVAYAVHGGVALVSPDPIGPQNERESVWQAFRHYADRNGWGVSVMAAAEEWLPVYRDAGMRYLYIGDEAVVDVQSFSLAGGKMKGLRQAHKRIERYGYTVHFFDPATIAPDEVVPLVELMGKNRRGEAERGFSMMLGRLFDRRDTDLLLTVVDGPDGAPAAMCQFVPSPAIAGYSLDLMRRDPGEHPNGLIDFALCSTIEHLKDEGCRGLSLNFAAMRSVLEGETGDGLTQRVERWALRRLSGVLQIETLYKFNAKYEPGWLPRYIVYDSPEQFVPAVVAIARAESLTEVPVVGRLLVPTGKRRGGPVVPDELTAVAAPAANGGPDRPSPAHHPSDA
ncbi:MAG TPA: phosphatidylglycerol lysyltransferase domain-containing protein [Acidimicrobiales bacterium]|nr:phosphatidylglycerol lysyltransferase domain-containing protein [Acidimicrobiales bacterium]